MPVNAGHLLALLVEAGYNNDKTRYLVVGFRQGFRLRLNRPIDQIVKDRQANIRMVIGNNKTGLTNPQVVEEKLTKELRAKRMIEPLLRPVFLAYVISPLGLRAKKVPGKFRLIQDLSAPFEGMSVNFCIPMVEGTVTYDTVDTAIQHIQRAWPGTILAKTDVEHVYKLVPIHLEDIPALGLGGSSTGCGMQPCPWDQGRDVPYLRHFLRLCNI